MDLAGFGSFVALGFGHITAPGALDHILFLLAVAAVYRWQEWRQALLVVTAFTIGHSITLAVAALRPSLLPTPGIVEFLIPLTIVAAGVENLLTGVRRNRVLPGGRRALLVGCFGLVHGAGFAGYLSQVFPGSVAAPLFGFNIGLELGQAVVLTGAFGVLTAVDAGLRVISPTAVRAGLSWRVASVSVLVVMLGSVWALERAPW